MKIKDEDSITVRELAEQTHLSKSTIYRMIKKGKIKHKKEGQTIKLGLTAFWKWYYKDIGYEI